MITNEKKDAIFVIITSVLPRM